MRANGGPGLPLLHSNLATSGMTNLEELHTMKESMYRKCILNNVGGGCGSNYMGSQFGCFAVPVWARTHEGVLTTSTGQFHGAIYTISVGQINISQMIVHCHDNVADAAAQKCRYKSLQ